LLSLEVGSTSAFGGSILVLVPKAATGMTESGERPFFDKFLYPTVGAVVAAAVTAGITYYVVKQSNERTTKDAIVAEIGDLSSSAIVSAQSVANRTELVGIRDPGEKHRIIQQGFTQSQGNWARGSGKLAGELQAYFGPQLVQRWFVYSDRMEDYILLSAEPTTKKHPKLYSDRANVARRLRKAVAKFVAEPSTSARDWARLRKGLRGPYNAIGSVKRQNFKFAYRHLARDMYVIEGALLRSISGSGLRS